MKDEPKRSSGLIRAKTVMIGSPSVGKSSLVRRFVHSLFSEEYHSTLGVKVDRKSMTIEDRTVNLILWDMHGEKEGLDIPASYLGGTRAALVVFDAARPETIEVAAELRDRIVSASPGSAVRVVANKADLAIDWPEIESVCDNLGLPKPSRTSAKTGDGVEDVFTSIGQELVG